MSRGAQLFRQADVAKAIKATVSAGLPVRRVEIARDGKIVVVIGAPDTEAANDNEWDSVQ
jgi:nitrate reductase NapAB chaperone NapD